MPIILVPVSERFVEVSFPGQKHPDRQDKEGQRLDIRAQSRSVKVTNYSHNPEYKPLSMETESSMLLFNSEI